MYFLLLVLNFCTYNGAEMENCPAGKLSTIKEFSLSGTTTHPFQSDWITKTSPVTITRNRNARLIE